MLARAVHFVAVLSALQVVRTVCNAPLRAPGPADAGGGFSVRALGQPPEPCVRRAAPGDLVRFHCNGSLADGTTIDSSSKGPWPETVALGAGELPAWLEQALLGMCVSERRLAVLPPDLVQAAPAFKDVAPLGSTLHLELLLLDVWSLSDEVQVRTVRRGPGNCSRTVEMSDYVRYHYNCTLLDGTFVSSSRSLNGTYNTYVGMGWLIQGMDTGLLGACVGEVRVITIPPSLGYAEEGSGDTVPSNATLVFTLHLVDLHNPRDSVTVDSYLVPEPCRRRAASGDFVRYHYNGSLLDGTIFDSTQMWNHTYDTYLGKGFIIAGMEEGLIGTCIGERRLLTIPPHLGYGEAGIAGKIPGSAVLLVNVHMVDLHNPADSVDVETYSSPHECAHRVQLGDLISMHYNTTLLDGTPLYSSRKTGWTYEAKMGSGQLIPGLEVGLKGMCVSEKRFLTIPPHLAFGEKGIEGEVPGSAVLLFDIELLRAEEGFPDGYMFVWKERAPPLLFQQFDADQDGLIALQEFSTFIKSQVATGVGRLAPGQEAETLISEMFKNQDRDGDGFISPTELKLKRDEELAHDEL
uniref:peptidylprolyl isomerase n=1 Tax=Petromyzon marinus TaxID=7757 RepID=A0AAJ7TCW1_PETMA|nr:peptidyl-prolyl cis-trans isomerase FKBP9-like [Petromyzon marinus]